MCGIAGILNYSGISDEPALTARMVERLKARGPDDRGAVTLDKISLGHTRLSIIDITERGHQPMSDKGKTVWIVFNGEIYNFQKIQVELQKLGQVFKSNCDTEVLLLGYKQWGYKILDKLRGMFAFAIWDADKKELFLARDRIGEKPLYYSSSGGRFYFASEMNALLECPIPREIDDLALCHYFYTKKSIPSPLSPYKAVKKLEQSHYMIVSETGIRKIKYWSPDYRTDKHIQDGDWPGVLRDKLDEVVKLELVSDVPICITLSGGVDSSSITALASRYKPGIETFTITSLLENDPELARAKIIVDRFKLKQHIIRFDEIKQYRPVMDISRIYGEPFAEYAHVYSSRLYGEVVKFCKTALTGNGADEIFLGYNMYNAMLRNGLFRIRELGSLFLPDELMVGLNFRAMQRGIIMASGEILTAEFMKKMTAQDLTAPYRHITENVVFRSALQMKKHFDLMYFHQHGLVNMADMSGMMHGLEARSPFLDHELIELVAKMPYRLLVPDKNNPDKNKNVLKKSMEGLLPDEVLYAKKMGFGFAIDFFAQMRTEWRREVERHLFEANRDLDFMVDKNKKAFLWSSFLGGDIIKGRTLIALLSFYHWYDFSVRGNK